MSEPAGAAWCSRYPTSTSVSDLIEPFRGKVLEFISALEADGARVTVAATYRPAERADLNTRLGKLDAFLNTEVFSSLPQNERSRMMRQWSAMCVYRAALDERIDAFQDVDQAQQLERFHNGVDNALAERISSLEKVIRCALLYCTCDAPLEVAPGDGVLAVKCPNHPLNAYQVATGD